MRAEAPRLLPCYSRYRVLSTYMAMRERRRFRAALVGRGGLNDSNM